MGCGVQEPSAGAGPDEVPSTARTQTPARPLSPTAAGEEPTQELAQRLAEAGDTGVGAAGAPPRSQRGPIAVILSDPE